MKKVKLLNSGTTLLETLIALAIFSTVMLGMGAAAIQSLRYTQEALHQSQALIQNHEFHSKCSIDHPASR